jgi:hypothetical protein
MMLAACQTNALAQFGGGGPAPRPVRVASSQMPSEEAKYKLATPCTDERESRTLTELLVQLRDDTLLATIIDEEVAESLRLDPDMTEIGGKWQGISWAEVLDNALPRHDLGYLVINRTVHITTQQKASETYFVVTYNVADLITVGHTVEALQIAMEEMHGCSWDCNEPGSGRITICRDLMVISQTQRAHAMIEDLLNQLRTAEFPKAEFTKEDKSFTCTYRVLSSGTQSVPLLKELPAEHGTQDASVSSEPKLAAEAPEPTADLATSLAEKLPLMVAPESWKESGGTGTICSVPGAIIVRQTPEVHRQLRRVLEPLCPQPEFSLYRNTGNKAPAAQ